MLKMWITLFGIFFVSVLNLCFCQDTVTVTISQGELRGRVVYTVNGAQYYSFQGIPYAKPPTGELRFRPPQPAESWEGVKDALTWGSVCPQPGQNGNEDCLFINVFSTQLPENSEENLKPVLVFIHGGGYLTGAGEFGPDYLLEQGDIVVVAMNYRLGALGFISLPGTEITSNNGLKDQNLALKWVQENIAQFGGDPNKVTIWGESAGATSVGMQMLSPMSKGLFRGVIADSGSVLTGWAVYAPGAGRSTAFQLGQYLGVSTNDTSVLIDALRKATVEEIVTATNSLAYLQLTMDIESEVGEGDEAFMPASPLDLLKQGNYNDVPLMIGINAQEGAINANLLDNQGYVNYINQYPEGLLPWQFNYSREIGALVKEFYFGDKEISHETVMQFSNVQTDFTYLFPTKLQAELQTAISSTPIYLYKFSFDGRFQFDLSISDSVPGVPHAEELNYIFFIGSTLPTDAPEMVTVARMAKMWTNFAKTQNPTPEEDSVLQNVTWSPFTQLDHFYMDIGNDLILGRDINNDRMGFVADMFNEIHIPE